MFKNIIFIEPTAVFVVVISVCLGMRFMQWINF